MIIWLFSLALLVLIVAFIVMSINVRCLSEEIDALRKELGYLRARSICLEFYNISDHERRLDNLENALELKEYFDEPGCRRKPIEKGNI